jgi:hypothetical protein
MGINSVEYDKFQYQAILETTSYFGHLKVDVEHYKKRSLHLSGIHILHSNIPSRNRAFALAGGPT